MNVDCIEHRELPGQNPLFLDYLDHAPAAAQFYNSFPASEGVGERASKVLTRSRPVDREYLSDLLAGYHRELGAGEATFNNIEQLRSPETLTIVTGQQVGLFGGPAYTVYKAATVIRLAQLYREQGLSVVPVFWLASDDSDYEEIRSSTFFRSDGGLETISLSERRVGTRMVGTLPSKQIESALESLLEADLPGNFRHEVVQMLRRAYSSSTLRLGFARWLTEICRDLGLIIFDPLLPGYKQLLRGVFASAVSRRDLILQSLRERGQALSRQGFASQVALDARETLLFWLDGDHRYKVESRGDGFRIRQQGRKPIAESELLREVEEGPEQFGPNVLLRPILQDQIFPNLAYVGGPAEVAYYAQVAAISPIWDMEVAVLPRTGVTVVDRKSQRLLKKYELQLAQILGGRAWDLTERIIAREDAGSVLSELGSLRKNLLDGLSRLEGRLEPVDSTVSEMLQNSQRKMLYQLDKVRRRFISNRSVHGSHVERHLSYLFSQLFPEGKLQERVINFNQLLMLEGPEFLGRLIQNIHPLCRGHHVVYL